MTTFLHTVYALAALSVLPALFWWACAKAGEQ